MSNEVYKRIQFLRTQCWYYWWDDFRSMTCIPTFKKIDWGIQILLRVISPQFERLTCLYCWWEGFLKYAVEIAIGGMIYIPSFIMIGTGVQAILMFCLRNMSCWYYWCERFINYAGEMGLRAMIYIYTKFHKDGFSHSKVNKRGYTHRHTENKVPL
jgi:hypothetical protein